MKYIKDNMNFFKKGAIITDIAGIKSGIVKEINGIYGRRSCKLKELIVELPGKDYPIYIEKGLFGRLGKEISKIYKGKKVAVVTDENIAAEYGRDVEADLLSSGFLVKLVIIKPGEKSKSLEVYAEVCDKLLEFGITKGDLIVAFGGGVTGDLAGFVASTLLRGITYVQVPTSLLAQVDSSVGGKVAIDHPRGKNLIGSFYHPRAVFIDPEILKTLDSRFLNDGMAEVIKYACIRSPELFEKLSEMEVEKDPLNGLEDIIYTCCKIKSGIVQRDEKDAGERMVLNFGHTLGHAIEKYYGFEKYSHGEAVAIGMYAITLKTEEEGITKAGTAASIKRLLTKYSLPFKIEGMDKPGLLEAIALDKKSDGDDLNIVVLSEIGDGYLKKIKKEEILRYL